MSVVILTIVREINLLHSQIKRKLLIMMCLADHRVQKVIFLIYMHVI